MAKLHIVRIREAVVPLNGSFEQERREVLESVIGALSSSVADADEMAACSYLLQHLACMAAGGAA